MKALVVGIDSQIGRALGASLRQKGLEVQGTSRRRTADSSSAHLDLTHLDGMADLPPCDVAFICAAETRLAVCHQNPESTARINVAAPTLLARHLARRGTYVVFLSSNAVFDGRRPHYPAEARPCPLTEYGKQKAEAEGRILSCGHGVAVLRLTKVLTPDMPLFTGWIQALMMDREINPFSDMVMAPIPLMLVTEALSRMALDRAEGLFQASAVRDVSYAEAACHIAARLGVAPNLVRPVKAMDQGFRPSEIPMHTTLETARLQALSGQTAPDPFDVIDQVFHLTSARVS